MQHSLSSLLFPEYRRRVLGLLLLHPEEALHGREIARRVGLSPGTTTRELNKLADAALLNRERRGNQQIYRANTGSPVFAELASILRKTSGVADVLSAALAELAPAIRVAFVYGSLARGDERAGSDIDLMIIGESLSYADVYSLLTDAEHTLGRKISPTLYSPADWQRRLDEANAFVTRVRHLPTLPIIGAAPGKDDVATARTTQGPQARG